MKLKIPVSNYISDNDLAKIKADNTKKVIALIQKGKSVDELCQFPHNFPKKFVEGVMQSYLFDIFSKSAKYQGGEYLIEKDGKILVAHTPKELFTKFTS